ncbi:hypothetical protein JCGZ_22357 [Jatropha curcas]|uniref:DUF241 domain protein n=1 Tax=Jatropha curcas TaxID=180498 RepID=A0A067LGR8_JATCU|nr:uncharacterized protein LOC105628536 [Jatropha curcas]KDP43730.1 hypothetical protein JCGZ_22357 [Jatropha curcas]
MANRYNVRSISFPSRSHPTTLKIEEQIKKLKTLVISSESICHGMLGLEDLYNGVNELLNLSSTQQVLSHHQNGKFLDRLLDGSVRLLDICGITRDVLLQFKEQVQSLQSAFRRRKGDSSLESNIDNYACFRKKMKKDAKKFIAVLKQMDTKLEASLLEDQDYHLIQLFKEVSLVTSFTFQSFLSFLSTSRPKKTRWSVISKLMNKGAIECEEKQEIVNQLESVDSLLKERLNAEKMKIAQKGLEALEMSIGDLENCLENMFRLLIKTRASILNIISQ